MGLCGESGESISPDGNIPVTNPYILLRDDFRYSDDEKELRLNIGKYYNKKLKSLLSFLFEAQNELEFDLFEHMKENSIKLILINELTELNEEFYKNIYLYFDRVGIEISYKGQWE